MFAALGGGGGLRNRAYRRDAEACDKQVVEVINDINDALGIFVASAQAGLADGGFFGVGDEVDEGGVYKGTLITDLPG